MQRVLRKIFMPVFAFAAAIVVAVILLCSFHGATLKASAASVDENYWFEELRVEINVNENKTYEIRERYKVGFSESGINTGFIRDIQRVSQTTRTVDGKQKIGKSYIAKLSGVEVTIDGGSAKVTQSYYDAGQFFSIKMQKEDESYFDATDVENETGFHDFVLSYVYDMSDDRETGFDDFTFDILGYEMALTKEFSATVRFPKKIDASSVSVRTNHKSPWLPNSAKKEEWHVENDTVYLTARPYAKEKGYTVQVLLPEDYFTEGSVTHFWYYWLFALPSLAIVVAGLLIAIKYFPRKAVEPVEVVPPKHISLMRASALWYGEARLKDVPAVILQWAADGFVTLEQNGKRDIIMHKVKELPAKAGNQEHAYFNALFTTESGEEGDALDTKKLRRSWSSGAATKQRKLYWSASALASEAEKPDPMMKGKTLATVLLYFSSVLPILLMLVYDSILSRSGFVLFFFIFLAAATAINYLNNKMGFLSFVPFIFLIAFSVPTVGWLLTGAFARYDYACLRIITVVWWAVAYILHFFMLRRSPEANQDLGRLKGFKRFLLTAELPRIKLLFDENPEWFSTVLPYCFVMGISKKVEKRYKALGIAAPEWLNGGSVSSVGRCVSRGIGSVGGGGSHGGGGGGGRGGSSGGGGGGGGSRGC